MIPVTQSALHGYSQIPIYNIYNMVVTVKRSRLNTIAIKPVKGSTHDGRNINPPAEQVCLNRFIMLKAGKARKNRVTKK